MFTNSKPTLVIVTYNTTEQLSGQAKIKNIVTTQEDAAKFIASEETTEDPDTRWNMVSVEKCDYLSEDMVYALCWIKEVQSVIKEVQDDVEFGIKIDLESAVEKIIHHSVKSATALLEGRGYIPKEPDHDLMGK